MTTVLKNTGGAPMRALNKGITNILYGKPKRQDAKKSKWNKQSNRNILQLRRQQNEAYRHLEQQH